MPRMPGWIVVHGCWYAIHYSRQKRLWYAQRTAADGTPTADPVLWAGHRDYAIVYATMDATDRARTTTATAEEPR